MQGILQGCNSLCTGRLGICTTSLTHKFIKQKVLFINEVIPNSSQADIAGLMMQDIIEGDIDEVLMLLKGPCLVTLLVLRAEGYIVGALKLLEGPWELPH
jgi:hypothetical protein